MLASLRDASELLRRLLDGGHSVVAGRLAGALRRLGRPDAADEIITTMKAAGYDVRESDPFEGPRARRGRSGGAADRRTDPGDVGNRCAGKCSPFSRRRRACRVTRRAFMQFVDDIYQSDAYHSLSIEGYIVSAALDRARERRKLGPGPP